jgi:hypothetical protein
LKDGIITETKFAPQYPNSKDVHSFESGLEFQDFVATKLHDYLGITITNYSSRRFQFGQGENRQGIEIKLDRLCQQTNRLSIEIAEKSKANNLQYVPSGIYRQDNSWLYIQGTWTLIFVFAKSTLLLLHKSGRYQEHTEKTVKGFYLSLADSKKYAAKVLELNKNGGQL